MTITRNNTVVVERVAGIVSVILHKTEIAVYDRARDTITLDTGGGFTAITIEEATK